MMEATQRRPLAEVACAGSSFERGRAFGSGCTQQIRAAVGLRRALLEDVGRGPLEDLVAEYDQAIATWVPELHEELRGMAGAASISVADAVLLQAHRELARAVHADRGGCTTFATVDGPTGPVVAQTVDLDGSVRDLGTVVRLSPDAPGAPWAVLYTLAGLLGYLGVNSAGLAVGINMLNSDDWKPGVPPYLLVRRVLAQTSLDAAVDQVRTLPRSSSRALTLCDEDRVLCIEMTQSDLRILDDRTILHTNHFLHPDFALQERARVLSRRSSKARLRRLETLRSRDVRPRDPAVLFDWLSDHDGQSPICGHGEGMAGRTETIAAVVLVPRQRRLLVRAGYPCRTTQREYLA